MAKGDDIERRKKNKANRKKMHQKDSSSSAVSARVAAIIAAKKRRVSGKRRQCQGMCFSLPTPDDPFNDRQGKKDVEKKVIKKVMPSRMDKRVLAKEKKNVGKNNTEVDNIELKVEKVPSVKNEKKNSLASVNNVEQKSQFNPGRTKTHLSGKAGITSHPAGDSENLDRPSKYLIMCLNEIDSSLRHDEKCNSMEDKPLFDSSWGIEFWRCYSTGKDIVETSRTSSTIEHIAWIACTSADTLSRKDEEDLSCASPFLLFLVPSQEKATEVRSVCKALKVHGIHTVSIHPGAPIDHQIQGLKNCEPEFLVATPERLLELVSSKAVDISEVSLLVIDGLESQYKHGYLDSIEAIKQSLPQKTQHLVFTDCLSPPCVHLVQKLLIGSVHRLCHNDSLTSQCACITQSAKTCAANDEKLYKALKFLDNVSGSRLCSQPSNVLFIVRKDGNFHKLVTSLKSKGYLVPTGSISDFPKIGNSVETKDGMRPAAFVIDVEQIDATDLSKFEVVVMLDFVPTVDKYTNVLTRMARYTVNGMLHSFLTEEDAELVGPLIEILQRCKQVVPKALRNMYLLSSTMEL